MSINLLDLVKDQVTGILAKEAGNFLGESESGITKALGGIMPTLLGGAIQKANSGNGAESIMGLINGLDLDDLANIAGVFGKGQSGVDGLMNSGGGILDLLLGNKSSGIADLIGGMSGLKSGSTSSLLKMAAPFLLGLIGKQIQGKGLGALTDLLMGQKNSVAKSLPAGVGSLLGLSALGDTNMGASDAAGAVDSGSGMSWLKWAIPILALLGIGWWMMKNNAAQKAKAEMEALEMKAKMAQDSIEAAAKAAATAAASLFDKTLSSGFKLVGATASGIESQLVAFIEDKSKPIDKETWFDFDRLLFDSAKATLQPSSQEQLVNVAEILKAFPSVKIKIGGYTDNVGDDKLNMKLSQERANTVKNELIKLGIDKGRMEAEGYGEQHPADTNDTEEGRQKNRRIAIRVTQK